MKNDTQIYAFDWKQMTSQFGGKEWMLIEMDLMTLHHQQQQQCFACLLALLRPLRAEFG